MGWFERLLINTAEPLLQRKAASFASGQQRGVRLGNLSPLSGGRILKNFVLNDHDRVRHQWLCGGSGSGKSTFLLNQCLQDFVNGQAFALVDPHDLTAKFLRLLTDLVAKGKIPESRLRKIILIDPSRYDWTTAFNPLAADNPNEAFRHAIMMLGILKRVWPDVSWGARTEELARNLLILLAERQLCLTAAGKVLHDTNQLRTQAEKLTNQESRSYWLDRYLNLSPSMRSVCSEPVMNKLTVFLSDPRIRSMFDQSKSDFNFRMAMDQGYTVLVDLNRGQLQDSVPLLASLFLLAIQKAAFSRTDTPQGQRRRWFVIVDEFTSFAPTSTLEPLLNEGRKFGIGLTLANQTTAAIDRQLLDSLRANCLTQMFFRLSPEDARLATAALPGELRELTHREIASLPVGAAALFQGGNYLGRLKIENVTAPDSISPVSSRLIDKIRRQVGRPPIHKSVIPEKSETAIAVKTDKQSETGKTVPVEGKEPWELLGDVP